MSSRRRRPVLYEIAHKIAEKKRASRLDTPRGEPDRQNPQPDEDAALRRTPAPQPTPATANIASPAPEPQPAPTAPPKPDPAVAPPANIGATPAPESKTGAPVQTDAPRALDGAPFSRPVKSRDEFAELLRHPGVRIGAGAAVIIVIAMFVMRSLPTTPEAPENSVAAGTEFVDAPPASRDEATGPAARTATTPDPQPVTTTTIELLRGYQYIVVQHFPSTRSGDAIAAAEYLTENGITCALHEGADIRLIAVEPFQIDSDNKETTRTERRRANAMLKRIADLGSAYRLHGYDFNGATLRAIR